MANGLVCVMTFTQRLEAEMAQSYLASHEIPALVSANDAGGMNPLLLAGSGGVRLLVSAERQEEARELLEAMETPPDLVDEATEDEEIENERTGSDMKVAKACWECGSEEIYRAEVSIGSHLNQLLPHVSLGFLGLGSIDIYVCTHCGYYRLFVPEKYLPQIEKKWKKFP